MAQATLSKRIIIYQMIGFGIVIFFVWIDGLFDIPHHLFGHEGQRINITESIFETAIVLLFSSSIILLTSNLLNKIKSMNEMLGHQEAYFRTLVENASDIILILSADGHIHYGSPSMERLLGYNQVGLIGQDIFAFIHPDDKAKVTSSLAQTIKDRDTIFLIEFQIRDQAGSWHIVEAVGHNLLDDTTIAGVVINARDITLRRQLETQLGQRQKLEAIGRLAGGMAHHFNNLLTIITGYTGLVLARPDLEDTLRQDIEQIKQAANRAASLIHQILIFSHKQIFELRLMDLNVLIADTAKMLQQLLGEKIELVLKLDRTLGLVKVEPGQIAQVIISMVNNARDAMPEGGRLVIETANVELDRAFAGQFPNLHPGPYISLSISDTGVGMDINTLAHLFEPFFTTKEPGKGTGLGLATAHSIINQSGGHIVVSSQPGQGASFKIYLPRAEADMILYQPPRRIAAGSLETILVVEDEDTIRELICRTLRESGYTVLEAQYGLEALQISRSYLGPIHLLMVDVRRPELSGRELAEYLTLLCPEIRVIYISSSTDNRGVQQGQGNIDMLFLAKPFTPLTLARRVREALDRPAIRTGVF